MKRHQWTVRTRDALRPLTTACCLALCATSLPAQDLVITDVTVIDPASGAVRTLQTVVIDEGSIRSIGPERPEGSEPETVVDGSGKFLIPGLWDMHVHLDMHTEADLVMLVVNGVLNVRDMGGDPFDAADRKARIASGDLIGPTIRSAGSILEDRRWLTRVRTVFPDLEHRVPVDNPEEARATIALLASWGADHVKIRNVTDEPTLRATLDAAVAHGLTVAGHEPMVVDIDRAAELGMTTFEHLPFTSLTMPGKQADAERVAEAIERLRASGAYIDPTFIASRMLGATREERQADLERPDERFDYLPDSVREQWVTSLDGDAGPLPWTEMRDRSIGMLRQMHAAGIPVLAGTDMGVPRTFPGSSLHDELGMMAEGLELPPLEVLRTATTHPASLFGVAGGSIAVGMPADLVLLGADPLASIDNTRTIDAVILRGELFDRERLDALLEQVRKTKDDAPGTTAYERMETACKANPTADCLERLAGYRYSRGLYAEARETYAQAIDAGATPMALEGLFASSVNLLHADKIDCAGAAEATDALLARHVADPTKTVGVLDRIVAPASDRCAAETQRYLTALAEIPAAEVDEEMRSIHGAHYASYLVRVRQDVEAAYAYRTADLPDDWNEDYTTLSAVATWCLEQRVALETARGLAQQAQQRTSTPIGRFRAMMLEARIASADGDHAGAVALMETLDQAVPNNSTITTHLEQFRALAAETTAEP